MICAFRSFEPSDMSLWNVDQWTYRIYHGSVWSRENFDCDRKRILITATMLQLWKRNWTTTNLEFRFKMHFFQNRILVAIPNPKTESVPLSKSIHDTHKNCSVWWRKQQEKRVKWLLLRSSLYKHFVWMKNEFRSQWSANFDRSD